MSHQNNTTLTLLLQERHKPSGEHTMIESLTEREREVIRLLSKGLRNREIAEHLRVSLPTVRHHLTSIYKKLGVSDRLELVIFAYLYELH